MSNSSNSVPLVCNKNKRRESKRRYLLCKTKKKNIKRPKMETDEVATGYKLKQFLADVEKFSERSKHREVEKTMKPQTSNQCQEKRGLFEKGMLSKPSVKGILGLKNKARLTGNLENLLDEGEKSITNLSEIESTPEESFRFEQSLLDVRRKDPKEAQICRETASPDRICNLTKNRNIKAGISKEDTEKNAKEMDNVIKFPERNSEICSIELKASFDDILSKEYKEDFLQKQRKHVIGLLEKKFLKCALTSNDELLKNLKIVCEEYIQSIKPAMVDKCEQTEECSSSKSLEFKETVCFSTDNVFMPEKNNLFDFSNKEHAPEKTFSFHPKLGNKSSSIMPQEASPVFRRKEMPVETPKGFKTKYWQPFEKNDTPYVPPILSPPSPGRKYAMSPDVLSSINGWLPKKNHSSAYNKLLMSSLDKVLVKEHTFPDLKKPSHSKHQIFSDLHPVSSSENNTLHNFQTPISLDKEFNCNSFNPSTSHMRSKRFKSFEDSDELMDVASSSKNNFLFPKRSKVIFSPHRL